MNTRQARWIERLLEFNITGFEHVAGKENKVADALSRRICGATTRAMRRKENERNDNDGGRVLSPTNTESEPESESNVNENGMVGGDIQGDVSREDPEGERGLVCGWDEEELKKEQEKKGWITEIMEYVQGKSSRFPEVIKVPRTSFLIEEGILYQRMMKREGEYKYRVVLPTSLHERALRLLHKCPLSGHLGVERTLRKAKDYYFWIGMKAKIKQYVGECHECTCVKYHKTVCPEGRQWPIVPVKFFRLHMDLVGPLPIGNRGH